MSEETQARHVPADVEAVYALRRRAYAAFVGHRDPERADLKRDWAYMSYRERERYYMAVVRGET